MIELFYILSYVILCYLLSKNYYTKQYDSTSWVDYPSYEWSLKRLDKEILCDDLESMRKIHKISTE
jgi:hypothetical protein